MEETRGIIFGILAILLLFFTLYFFFLDKTDTKYKITTKSIVRVGIFSAISAIFYIFIKFPIPFFPSFLELHFDEIPAFIASFAYGPIQGLCVLLVKTIIKLPFTNTLGVGEIADLLYSTAFILPAAIIYRRKRNIKSVALGLIIGFLTQIAASLVINVFVMIPFYMEVMGLSEELILTMCQSVNPAIKDIRWSFGLVAVVPFNAIKNVAVIIVTLISYKSLHKFIDNLQK